MPNRLPLGRGLPPGLCVAGRRRERARTPQHAHAGALPPLRARARPPLARETHSRAGGGWALPRRWFLQLRVRRQLPRSIFMCQIQRIQ